MSVLSLADGLRREALGEWAEEALFAGTVLAAPAQNAYSHRFPSLKLAAVIGCDSLRWNRRVQTDWWGLWPPWRASENAW